MIACSHDLSFAEHSLSALRRLELTEELWHSRITLYFKSSQTPFHKERL